MFCWDVGVIYNLIVYYCCFVMSDVIAVFNHYQQMI